MTSLFTPAPLSLTTVLIANRGEIALRILRTVHALGLTAIAVHTDEDVDAPHVAAADRAVRLDSYLDVDGLIAAARAAGADALHPGYGFLSERPALARACEEAGIAFVGPSARAIETMGDKIAARAAVTARGVPVVPGLSAPGLDDAVLVAGAAEVGFPLLVKPAAGGGGKGMHVVESADALPAALAAARREAVGAFGDDTLFLERYVAAPRHLEVQILADAHGRALHLGERECSLQRRHQKVIEEAPSPDLTADQRERLGALALEVARSVDYVGAGTVEFLLDAASPDEPYFLEMNTRLQVEHAVTEEVTGTDLVAAQLRIADGQRLAARQEDVQVRGHALEARVYAEDPAAGFLPTGGTVLSLALPQSARVDHALATGMDVTSSYDPMLAKVITHAGTREAALTALDRALEQTHILGVRTNASFLRALLALPETRAGRVDTGLIERSLDRLAPASPGAAVWAVAAAVRWQEIAAARRSGIWQAPTGWRLGAQAPLVVRFAADGEAVEVALTGTPERAVAEVRSGSTAALSATAEHVVELHPGAVTVDGHRVPMTWATTAQAVWLGLPGGDHELAFHVPARRTGPGAAAPTLASPMPGIVTAVLAEGGSAVTAGDPVLVVEAMKMEHTLTAPSDGTVRLHVRRGDRVVRGQELAQVVTEETPLAAPSLQEVHP
ncbi:ATP-binding protein [Brachybacterium aquaticum]|uniref:biotin carboxylase n=1 Tax=Brachybacterium aquaticum TaxID=1432564 RepID=A0A841AI37_9MICO|nr:biotin carboxylase N-terminal domain-containing protein [Brachybacterium aquaticum]MBB5832922.1 acetyl-CoA/propionyl-CoA carboxylase biotin carboxyl carrier protein [Brachybacterium aquaticum]